MQVEVSRKTGIGSGDVVLQSDLPRHVTFQVGSGMDHKASNPIANDTGPGRPLQGVVSSRILLPGFFPQYINDKLKIPRAISHLKYLHMY